MSEHLDESGVRHWTDILARLRFGTQLVNGRRITSGAVKNVGNRLASYADYRTGTRVRPGLARIAVDLEIDYKTAKAAVAVLRRVGLLRLVAAGGRSGNADHYQLVIPADLLDREDAELLTVAAYELEIERKREKSTNRGPCKTGPTGARQQPVDNPLDSPPAQAPPGPVEPAEPAHLTGPVSTAPEPLTGPVGTARQAPPGPATTQDLPQERSPNPLADLRTAVTAPRAHEAEEPQDPSRCPKHMAMPRGRCQICRAQAPPIQSPLLQVLTGGAA